MAGQVEQGGLFAKYGDVLDKAVQKHAGDSTRTGFQEVPPGITNGVARLESVKFDKYKTGKNQGEYYFQARGTVIEPLTITHNGALVKVQGLQTMIQQGLPAVRNDKGEVTATVESNVDTILNHMRLLGGDDFTRGATGRDLEKLAAILEKRKPYFRFSTSVRPGRKVMVGGKEEREPDGVWQNWHGGKDLLDYRPPVTTSAVTGPATVPNGAGEQTVNRVAEVYNRAAESANMAPPFDEFAQQQEAVHRAAADNSNEEEEGPTEEEYAALAARASAKDGEAQKALEEMAISAGCDPQTVKDADTWEDVVTMIREKKGEGTKGEEKKEEKVAEPDKGLVCKFRPLNKSGKPGTKMVDVEVIAVSKKNETVSLKNLTDNKITYEKVAWGELIYD